MGLNSAGVPDCFLDITKTCPCNKQIFPKFLGEAVLTCIHNLYVLN